MTEFLQSTLVFVAYIIVLASLALPIRLFTKIPDEAFRKLLHFILLGAYVPLLFAFAVWWHAVLLITLLIGVLFPTLYALGRVKGFSSFVNERCCGEFKSSMVLALLVMASSTAVGWGLFGDRYLVLASVYAWGVGDGFAALVGKRYGRHKIGWRFVDNKKSYEGSFAMLATSAVAVFTVLIIRGGVSVLGCAFIALAAATASTFMELCTRCGMDTVTCPTVSMLVILPLVNLIGG